MQNRQIEFYIRSAELSDLDSIQKIYQSARDFMKANGNSTQWGNDRPHKKILNRTSVKKFNLSAVIKMKMAQRKLQAHFCSCTKKNLPTTI